ncbi:MAG TPA: S8 family serine peptidase [Kofleriaceae bacterium]|jgi:hypothetical protein
MGEDKSNNIRSGRKRYLVAPRRVTGALGTLGVAPMSAASFHGIRKALEGFGAEIVSVKGRPRTLAVAESVASTCVAEGTYVVRMDDDAALAFHSTRPPNLIIEHDAFLGYSGSPPHAIRPSLRIQSAPRSLEGLNVRDVRIQVVGEGGIPLPNAHVILESVAFPADGRTDSNGQVTLRLATMRDASARSLFVEIDRDYWSFYVKSPALDANNVNVIQLASLKSTVRGFPADYGYGWGQLLMGLDQVPAELSGRGVKLAIIDSGADNKHRQLSHLQKGQDYVASDADRALSWANDVVGHGTHCAGVIAAQGSAASAFRGFVPEAEVHILKIFPDGQFSSLLDALDYCIENEIDVVNMSLGSDEVSEVVEQKLAEAVDAGVACIVAAGNSAGPVQYPASSPNVFAVAAMGRVSEVLKGTWDAATVSPALVSPDGFFSPVFTCFGPQVRACAPGVAIISTVPGDAFEAQSGTSMAAPHVTGLGALVLAHHPALAGVPRGRDRVVRLFEVIRSSCVRMAFDPTSAARTGFGLPQLHTLLPAMKATLPKIVAPGAAFAPAMQAGPMSGQGTTTTDIMTQVASMIAQAVAQAIQRLPVQLGVAAAEKTASAPARNSGPDA